jgi:hypothetical protein
LNGCNPDFLNGDLTASRKFGDWEFGLVAFGSTDLTSPIDGYLKQSQIAVGDPGHKDAVTDKALLQPEGEPLWGLREIILGVKEQPPVGVRCVLDHSECSSRRTRERDAADEAMQRLRCVAGSGFRKMCHG